MSLQELFGSQEELNDFYNQVCHLADVVRNPYANHLLPVIEGMSVRMLGMHKEAVMKLAEKYVPPEEPKGNPDEVKEEEKTMPGNCC